MRLIVETFSVQLDTLNFRFSWNVDAAAPAGSRGKDRSVNQGRARLHDALPHAIKDRHRHLNQIENVPISTLGSSPRLHSQKPRPPTDKDEAN